MLLRLGALPTALCFSPCLELCCSQAAPGAFADSVTNVRVLSWLLLGALHANHGCLPVPIECSQHMADYIHFVLAGFADQSKVRNFTAFSFCEPIDMFFLSAVCRPHVRTFPRLPSLPVVDGVLRTSGCV